MRNGVWCYSCEQWFHFKCQGMKSMNSPEAEKWKITDEEYLCLGCKRHLLESKINELQLSVRSLFLHDDLWRLQLSPY